MASAPIDDVYDLLTALKAARDYIALEACVAHGLEGRAAIVARLDALLAMAGAEEEDRAA